MFNEQERKLQHSCEKDENFEAIPFQRPEILLKPTQQKKRITRLNNALYKTIFYLVVQINRST
jgi:hypothetical protein